MVTTLALDRGTTVPMGSRIAFTAAILLTLSTFAKQTASVLLDLPRHAPIHAEAATVKNPAIKAPARKLRIPVLTELRTGLASWYGNVLQNHLTASGKRFDMAELTAAHRSFPFGSKVKVTDLRNSRSVIVTITDRGKMRADRIIDLSYQAAERLGMVSAGVDPVRLELLSPQQAALAEAPVLDPTEWAGATPQAEAPR